MPVLRAIRERFEAEKPLAGLRMSACLHVTAETANLARTLAQAAPTSSSSPRTRSRPRMTSRPASSRTSASPFTRSRARTSRRYYRHIAAALKHRPNVTMDDGADLVGAMIFIALDRLDDVHPEVRGWASKLKAADRKGLVGNVVASMEETTTGVLRLRAMEKEGVLKLPVIAVNDAMTKHLFDNRYGTGQSTLDGVIRATDMLIAGRRVVVAGYGWCGKGVAMRAKGLGAHVIVTEVEPILRPGGGDGRLRGDADGEGRPDRRPVHHRHGQHPRHPLRALRRHEGRRDRLQLGPLQRRAGARRASKAREQ